MSGQSKFSRSLIAVAAALVVSSMTIGAAVGPAQASVSPIGHAIEKNIHA